MVPESRSAEREWARKANSEDAQLRSMIEFKSGVNAALAMSVCEEDLE